MLTGYSNRIEKEGELSGDFLAAPRVFGERVVEIAVNSILREAARLSGCLSACAKPQ
jgi:hypothetical protein